MRSALAEHTGRIWDLPLDQAIEAVLARLAGVRRLTVQGTLYRAMYAAYLLPPVTDPRPLFFNGSLAGRRYTPRKGPAGLYLSFDPSTPPAELRAVVFDHGLPVATAEQDPIVLVSVRTVVHRVLDLTDAATRAALELTRADLRADWERGQDAYLAGRGPMPATQLLALTAHLSGLFAGIKYPSARTDFGVNLVVFPDRLDADRGDHLEVVDSGARYAQHLP
ncbi:RES family NAD+ phosphorylase [Longimicrobium sp.]|uniref:RES family NAD+ phosphorylase n=1 Tax=Longimicrobium sp. TaxID=2029185 RepID=UPI002E2EFB9B|nr:RES family NAD+ phosphorylase [Longimicrobium sp.]HEX6040324.1 RES family NAD+ phosphorylase [Longimicrobium sp.]